MTTQDRQSALAQALNAHQMQRKVAMEQAEKMAILKLREDRAAEIKEENLFISASIPGRLKPLPFKAGAIVYESQFEERLYN